MKPMKDTSRLPASASLRQQSLGQWQHLLSRYPLTSRWGLAFHIASAFGANALIVWLVTSARMTPFELVLLVALEALLLVGIAWLHSRLVPASAREPSPMGRRERLGTLAFALVWLGGVYGLVLFAMVPSGEEIRRLLDDPFAFVMGSNLRWPLLITLVGALMDALQDQAHFRRVGGVFLSTPGLQGAARWMTLFLGGIPFLVPLAAFVFGLSRIGEKFAAWRRARGAGNDDIEALLVVVLVPVAMIGFVALFGALVTTQDSGWAVGYCAAKFVTELFIVCLPLIATTAHAEESAAVASPSRARRRSRLP